MKNIEPPLTVKHHKSLKISFHHLQEIGNSSKDKNDESDS